ncbi:MAG: hypothetical protein WA001_01025 [Patescibacteria group bacterium]
MFHFKTDLKRDLILVGDSLLSACAFPGMALANHVSRGPSQLPLGIVMTVFAAPVTVPAMLVFGPVLAAYGGYFGVKEIRLEIEAEERRQRRDDQGE